MGIIFSSFNGLKPKIRFASFSENYATCSIGDIFDERSERGNENLELLSVTMNNGVKKRTEIEGKDNSSEDKGNYKIVHIGDMVYNSMRMWQGANGISQYNGIVSPAYTVLKASKPLCDKYIGYLFKNSYLINKFRKSSQGLTSDTWNLKYPQIATIKIYLPSLPEQQKIADFLTLVDARIEKQRQLVEALKKYKRGALTRVFSNIEDWKKVEAKDIATIETGCSNTQDNNPNGLYPFYIRSANIAHSDKYIYDGEAVLTIGDGQIGKVYHYINGKFDCHQRVYMITKFKEVSGRYFYHFFSTFFYSRAMKMSAKNTVDSVRMDMIAKMPIYFPDKPKQDQVVSILDAIDSYIEIQSNLLTKMYLLKKGFLQQMFI